MKKNRQFAFIVFVSVIIAIISGFFSYSFISETAFANEWYDNYSPTDNGGGIVYVGNGSKFNMTNGSLGGGSATNGGGVYVASGGTFNLSGGEVVGNTATNVGNNIYNSGTFTMTGGTVGQNGSATSNFGIYNTGTMILSNNFQKKYQCFVCEISKNYLTRCFTYVS